LDLDTIRQRVEAFCQSLYHAMHRCHIGKSSQLPLQQLFADAAIFDKQTVAILREALLTASPAERGPLQRLFHFVAEGALRRALLPFDQTIAQHYDQLPFPGTWAAHDAIFVLHLAENRLPPEAVAALLPLHQQRWDALLQEMRDLGFVDISAYWQQTLGIDLADLVTRAEHHLAQTHAEYLHGLRSLGEFSSRQQLEQALRLDQFGLLFPEAELVPMMEDTLYHLGVDITRQPNLVLEVNRELPTGSTMAFPVRVPEEIYVVVAPSGGVDAYTQALHVTGMILPRLLISPEAPWVQRRLLDHSIQQAHGALLAGLLQNAAWLSDLLGFPEEELPRFSRLVGLRRLYCLRRAAARLIFAMDYSLGQADYVDTFTQALGVPHQPADLALDMGSLRRSLQTWQGLQAGFRLEESILQRFGPAWYRDPAATQLLHHLWSCGKCGLGDER
jgi:hypothetical protein